MMERGLAERTSSTWIVIASFAAFASASSYASYATWLSFFRQYSTSPAKAKAAKDAIAIQVDEVNSARPRSLALHQRHYGAQSLASRMPDSHANCQQFTSTETAMLLHK